MWYIDSGESFHMTRNKEYFSQLKEKDMQFHIELGDDGGYLTKGMDTVSFQRESGNSLHVKDVLYILGPKKNLVSISTLKDKSYDVIFSRGKAYLNFQALRIWIHEAKWCEDEEPLKAAS